MSSCVRLLRCAEVADGQGTQPPSPGTTKTNVGRRSIFSFAELSRAEITVELLPVQWRGGTRFNFFAQACRVFTMFAATQPSHNT